MQEQSVAENHRLLFACAEIRKSVQYPGGPDRAAGKPAQQSSLLLRNKFIAICNKAAILIPALCYL